MIWAALAMLGIPLWLIAIFLLILIRSRSAVKKIPGSFACKTRATTGEVAGLHDQFPRYDNRAHWVHDVLVVHGGNPFLILIMPLGVVELASQPEPPDPMAKHLNRVEDPVSLRYRLDSGAVIEVVCTKADVGPALGPFPAPTPAA